jgi:CBS domain-containing protein
MQVQQVMSRPVDVINPNATSREAARRMRDEHIGALPVGENDELLGMVTDRDRVARSVAKNMLPGNTAVSSVMSEGVYHCFEDDTLEEAARIMAEHQVRRLPVLNRNQQLVGIIAIADIARTGDKEAEDTAIEGVSQPSDEPRR